ncbi:DinB family protein [Ciceribacter sp. L1K22]|uniref:DinB family protein n=1 Tax=Ciceribacter sp. L1K22 TaxID=2820275 RepID=UPI001ABDF6B5|nr:DinB family protein [Ciceribacter sp. L1K22]MBO3759709.1 damage-inducible protein DinB [Ciceribacter sp. L1K22]
MTEHYRMFAAYNAWANGLLYTAAEGLSDGELHADKGAFFGSLFATLTHLVVTDRLWMHRFTGEGPVHRTLDEKPFADFAALSIARQAEDERIVRWADTLTPEQLSQTFTYTPVTNPTPITHKLAPAVAHFFNHQTHHRGQCHSTLTALGKPSLSLDLIYFLRSDGKEWL